MLSYFKQLIDRWKFRKSGLRKKSFIACNGQSLFRTRLPCYDKARHTIQIDVGHIPGVIRTEYAYCSSQLYVCDFHLRTLELMSTRDIRITNRKCVHDR